MAAGVAGVGVAGTAGTSKGEAGGGVFGSGLDGLTGGEATPINRRTSAVWASTPPSGVGANMAGTLAGVGSGGVTRVTTTSVGMPECVNFVPHCQLSESGFEIRVGRDPARVALPREVHFSPRASSLET